MSKFKVNIKSIFEEISQEVFKMNSITDIQKYVTEFVNTKNIESKDKQSILTNIMNCQNVKRAQTYICNSLLRFEGLSVNKYDSVTSINEVEM